MGGLGSGNRRGNRKTRPVIDGYLNLDILDFNKQGLLKPGTNFEISYSRDNCNIQNVSISVSPDSLSLKYHHHQVARQQEIRLTRSSCHYGGGRTWLVCGKCGCKRNGLYLGPKGVWGCRKSLGLVYHSQRLNPHERHSHMAQKIKRTKLKITPENPALVSELPFGMSSKKYIRILDEILRHEQKSHKLFKDWFDEIVKKADAHI